VLSHLVNRWIAPLPLFRSLCLVTITTARPVPATHELEGDPSISVVIAARNESGNIAPLLDRIPVMASRQEVILVEGGSSDDTWDTIQHEVARRQGPQAPFAIIAAQQPGKGKADAVREGFKHATGDILIILDADISVPPEELPRFIDLLRSGTCEFANGSRLVYPMDDEAMRFLNLVGNRLFGMLFSYLLGQPIRDTLCGTKALWASDYRRIEQGRSYFGDFDPFGDFDLLFGAARLGLRIRDVPVHYKERVYGSTNISRFRHGLLLLKMSAIAARRLRFTSL
jgi:glycosyltransferase involved in cell wall biosynthesis